MKARRLILYKNLRHDLKKAIEGSKKKSFGRIRQKPVRSGRHQKIDYRKTSGWDGFPRQRKKEPKHFLRNTSKVFKREGLPRQMEGALIDHHSYW